ncbi:hypothetical protein L596_005792 [Steinernema carpocapsae]|uniref:Uncharacterized protein n=1 Tax=Steinernema carpocapsae TaxID=34508 RepID=A0A4U8V049_STECR|nr:hypothetical protein L596_005792 [Steinernema carpocapsae]
MLGLSFQAKQGKASRFFKIATNVARVLGADHDSVVRITRNGFNPAQFSKIEMSPEVEVHHFFSGPDATALLAIGYDEIGFEFSRWSKAVFLCDWRFLQDFGWFLFEEFLFGFCLNTSSQRDGHTNVTKSNIALFLP